MKWSPLAALVKSLASSNPGLCVVTTREPLDDVVHLAGTTAPCFDLRHLTPEGGAHLLRQTGVQGTERELRAAAEERLRKPLTLTLSPADRLGELLVDEIRVAASCRLHGGGSQHPVDTSRISWETEVGRTSPIRPGPLVARDGRFRVGGGAGGGVGGGGGGGP